MEIIAFKKGLFSKFEDEWSRRRDWFNQELERLQVGRVSPKMVSFIKVEVYEQLVGLNALANIQVPIASQLLIKPYDRANLKAIQAAINKENLGFNAVIDDDKIRINMPPITEQTRRLVVKKAKEISEQTKIYLRNIRKKLQLEIRNFKDSNGLSNDFEKQVISELDKRIKETNSEVEQIFKVKETDLMTV